MFALQNVDNKQGGFLGNESSDQNRSLLLTSIKHKAPKYKVVLCHAYADSYIFNKFKLQFITT